MSVHSAKPEHEVLYQDLVKLASKHAANVSSLELLAIASNMLGKLLAMQDQRKVTREIGLEIIIKNIELGNQQVIKQLNKTSGSA